MKYLMVTLKSAAVAAAFLLAPGFLGEAHAYPLLQLDMKGGVYDPVSQTVVAPGGQFTVFAILTPSTNATPADVATLLNTNFYVAVALTPATAPPGVSAGSFSFGPQGGTQTTVNATSGMTYGTPPLETTASLQGFDPGDLSKHGIYPTYFSEFQLNFSAASTALAYDTSINPGGPTPDPNGTAYYFAFTGDSSLLAPGYQLHFDLYSEAIKDCATKNSGPCTDVDVDQFAPFSHDAETVPYNVPEPSTAIAMLLGLGVAGRKLFGQSNGG